MSELIKDTYLGIFKFELFHERIRRRCESSKKDVCINIRKMVTEELDLWVDYQPACIPDVVSILNMDIFQQYDECADPDGNVVLPPIEKRRTPRDPDMPIRFLAKECLEKSHTPVALTDIRDYINSRREKPVTSDHSLRTSLIADKASRIQRLTLVPIQSP